MDRRQSKSRTAGYVSWPSDPSIVAAAALWGLAALLYLAAETTAAHALPGYSYSRDYISLLGEPRFGHLWGRMVGSPLSGIMNTGFICEGALYIVAAGLTCAAMQGSGERKMLFAVCLVHGVGNILVGIFHAGQAATNMVPLHPIGAIMAISGGNLASIYFPIAMNKFDLSSGTRTASVLLGSLGLACLLMLGVNITLGQVIFPDGVWERGSVYAITAWEFLVSASMLRRATVLRSGRSTDRGV